ncbi:MAG TPA: PQQ-binding-like beta-propeller repeat protein [Pirellulales bacterium]|jgi:outer membrane protein assembly factor BamB|nr:PQQ-binding-like beta-propeller repeat protein [Pirellulales bacterium]
MSTDLPSLPPSAPVPPADPPAKKRGFAFPIVVIVLALAALIGLELIESVEALWPIESFLSKFMTPFLGRVIVVGLSLISLFLWFVLFSPFSWGTRLGGVAAAVLALVAAGATFKVEGYTGDIRPRIRLRWAAPPELPQAGAESIEFGPVSATDSPEFLGRGRRATIEGVRLAIDWVTNPPKQLWRQPIGAAWSSFATAGPYAVTQEQRGDYELVSCYEIASGKLRWAYASPGRFTAALAGLGPRATPTIDGGRVYALGALGNLVCLEGSTGKPIWSHDIVRENEGRLPQWGKSCSPLVYENAIIVSAGAEGGKSLVAYDKTDGHPLWSAGDEPSSYSSPTLVTLAGQPQILLVGAQNIVAHDPTDGHVLWQHVWPENDTSTPNVSQPLAVGDDRLLLSKGYGVGSALWHIKRDGDQWSVEELWRNANMKTKMTNAVLRDGFAYGLDEGILSCIDVATGSKKWKRGKYGHGQVLLVGDLLLVQSEQGDVALVAADPAGYRELSRFAAISGQSWNYPALAGNKLLVRSEQEAACYELPLEGDTATAAR